MNSSIHFSLKTLFCSISIFVSFTFYGKQYRRLDLEKGLPGNTIKCIFKDSKGLMWIATETGLCTYDGKNIHIIDEKFGLPHNLVWKIIEDDRNNLWFSIYGHGVAKYSGKKFTFYNTKHGLVNNSVRTLYYSKKHKCMVLGTEDGVSLFDGKRFQNFKKQTVGITGNFQVNFAAEHGNQIIIAAGNEFIYTIDFKDKDIRSAKLRPFSKVKDLNYAALVDGDKLYNMTIRNELQLTNIKSQQRSIIGKSFVTWDFVKGLDKQIYTASWEGNGPDGGIYAINGNQIEDLSKKFGLPTRQFWCLYFDKQSATLWAGTIDDGIYIIDLNPISHLIDFNLPPDIPRKVNTICQVQNTLYVGGNGYIIKKTQSNELLLTSKELISKVRYFLQNKAISSELKKTLQRDKHFVCHSIKNDSKGKIWAMTNFGLIQFDSRFKIFSIDFAYNTGGHFEFTQEDAVLFTQNYRFTYLKNGTQLQTVLLNGQKKILDASAVVRGFKTIWITSRSEALFVYEHDSLKQINTRIFGNENNFTSLAKLGKNRIAVGTVNGKIFICNWVNGKLTLLKIFLPDRDLIGNTIFFIKPYLQYFLVGTNKGINVLNKGKLIRFFNYEENIHLANYLNPEFDFQHKHLLVPVKNGLLEINLDKMLTDKDVNGDLYFSSFKVNNQPIKLSKHLKLEHNQNNVEVSFLSNNLFNHGKNRYRYKFLGDRKTGWSTYSPSSTLKFFELSPGRYELMVEGKNIGTGEQFKPIYLKILIERPFYEQPWFVILIINCLTLFLIISYRYHIKRIRRQSELKIRNAENKLFALQSQMKPHFLFNAINSIQNVVIDNQTEKALTYIGKFSKLIRQTLHLSDQNSVSLQDEISYLEAYIHVEKLRFGNEIEFVFDIDEKINLQEVFIKPMLIQPIIENAFVHAFDSKSFHPKIEIFFSREAKYILCTVKDNGNGMHQSENKLNSSKGLKLVIDRIQLIDPKITDPVQIKPNTPNGTIVTLQIPVVR